MPFNCIEGGSRGIALLTARPFAALPTLLLIAGAFFASVADARAKAPSDSCENAAELAVLTSPIAPWKGAPLRVVFAADEPLDGELTLIAPDGNVSAKSRERHGGPPYFYFAEVASPAVGTWHAKFARDGATAECSTIAREIAVRACTGIGAARDFGERLAVARYMEPRDGEFVFRMDREALRRAARCGAVVAGAA